MQASYIGAYWGDRRETAFECGERLSRCLLGLGAVDPLLAAWFLKGATRSTATVPIALGADDLASLFDRGRNRRDSDGEVIEELGFRVGLWNNRRPALVNRPGVSGDSKPWEGWSHVREHVEEVSG
jgi:Immunity protein 52